MNVMFNNTSLDVADTYRMVKSHPDWVITNPKEGFYQWCQRQNFIPTRHSRGCCSIFKEGASIKYFKDNNVDKIIHFMGVRNDESTARSEREYIGSNPKWSNPNWLYCLPIRKWTDLDVWLYILSNNLEINPRYKKGYHRVGCAMACPFANKSTWVLDKYWYPNLYNRWHQIIEEIFLNSKRWQQVNCTLAEYHSCWNGGLYRPEPTEEVIQEMMSYCNIKDRNIAVKYFNKTCHECGKNVRQRDVLGMNLKILGRETNKLFCKKCFLKLTGMTKDKYDDFRPIFWYSNSDKEYYENHFSVEHSKCYTEYGLSRTGCCGCPYGRDFEKELEIIQKYELKLYKACINIFGESYEYTRKYREFVKEMKAKEKESV